MRRLRRVLLVDDEARILNFLKYKLKASGYEVFTAHNGLEALEMVEAEEPDLMVLDLVMPEMSGFETLKRLRSFSPVPVIILSARGSDADKIEGLELGADDYLPKPFNPDELMARIEAVARRVAPPEKRKEPEIFSLGDLTIDFKKRSVVFKDEGKYLTRIEWLLLSELALNAGRLMTYEELLTRIWGVEYRSDVQLLRTWVSRLRFKLEKDAGNPKLIRTIPKAGYIIDQPPA